MPGVGIGTFLVAVGAILTFAVTVQTEGFNLNSIGIILMIVGGVAILLSLLFWSSWFGSRDDRAVVRDDHVHGH